jgi:hypothetical protein
MPGNDAIPFKRPGEDITAQVTAAVVGKRFVAISGDRTSGPGLAATAEGSNYRVAHCGAALQAIGVSKYDQATVGGKVGVMRGGIVPVTAGSAITFGQAVESNASGQAVPFSAGIKLGIAMTGAAGGADAEIALLLA